MRIGSLTTEAINEAAAQSQVKINRGSWTVAMLRDDDLGTVVERLGALRPPRRLRELLADVDPVEQNRVPLPAGSVASTAPAAASADPQAHATATAAATSAPMVGRTAATTATARVPSAAAAMNCTAAATHASARVSPAAAAHAPARVPSAAAAATSPMTSAAAAATAASRCKSYAAGAKLSFSVKNVKSCQADVRYFLLSEKDPGFSALRRHLHSGRIR